MANFQYNLEPKEKKNDYKKSVLGAKKFNDKNIEHVQLFFVFWHINSV